MAEITTVARPYAEAVFSLAKEHKRLDAWHEALVWLATMVQNGKVAHIVTNPKHSAGEVESLLLGILGERGNDEVKRFIAVLIANSRLMLLPEIAKQFETLKASADGEIKATVESAFTLTDAQVKDLNDMLSKHYAKTLKLDVHVKPDLIGGVRIQIGDDVLDASVRGKLYDLAASLTN